MSRRELEEREERQLRRFFAQVHARDRVPSFERLVAPPRRSAVRRWVAAAAVLLLALAVAWWLPLLDRPAGSLSADEQLALARELSGWRGPLDFLLETPGSEILRSPPRLGLETLTIPPPPAEREEDRP